MSGNVKGRGEGQIKNVLLDNLKESFEEDRPKSYCGVVGRTCKFPSYTPGYSNVVGTKSYGTYKQPGSVSFIFCFSNFCFKAKISLRGYACIIFSVFVIWTSAAPLSIPFVT